MLGASRGWGPALRKGDFLALTILNMQVLTTLATAQAGGCAVMFDRNDPVGVAEWIRDERVTVWNGPPALIHSLAYDDAVAPDDLASLDEVWNGGGDCPEPVRVAFEEKFGKPVLMTYGLSEAPTVVTIDDPDGTHTVGGSGRPLPHLEIHVIDDELCVAPATSGEYAGVYRPMLGYWNRDDATAETLRDGLLHTGDLGFVDDDGFLHVRDRKSLVIIRGGGNVYPAEIERVLHERDEVEACAVVGLPDERLGERVAVAVQLRDGASVTEDELARALPGQPGQVQGARALAVRRRLPPQRHGQDPTPRPPRPLRLEPRSGGRAWGRSRRFGDGSDAAEGAAVDREGGAGDPAGGIAGEEHDRGGHLVRVAVAAHRHRVLLHHPRHHVVGGGALRGGGRGGGVVDGLGDGDAGDHAVREDALRRYACDRFFE